MDVRFLQSLIAVVETGSIAAAARRENRTAAAISQRVQALERSLGYALLLRTAHATRPTDQCLLVLPKIRAIIEQTQALQNDLALSAPALKLKITPGDSKSLYEKVLAGELDAAILVRPPFQPPKALTQTVLKVEPLVLVAPASHAGQSLETLLRAGPFIRYDARSWGGQIAQRYLDERAIEPNVLCELDALETIVMLVAQGMGVSLVPQWAAMALDGVCAMPVEDGQRYSRELVVMHSSTPHRPLAMRHLLELLCSAS